MISIEEINDTIEELENGEITLKTCNDLANLYIIQKHMQEQDLLPDSNIDEKIDELQTYAIRYVMERDILQLNYFLTNISQIISELYHTSDTEQERKEFKSFIDNINSIVS